MMVTPFMICGAKTSHIRIVYRGLLPRRTGGEYDVLMYGLSVLIAFASAWALKKFIFKGEASHFVMELPPYRVPTIQGLLLKMWERGWLYIKKAGTIILLISIVIWAGFTFPQMQPKDGMNEEEAASAQMEQSFAGRVGKLRSLP